MPHIHELYDFTVSAFVLHPTKPKICLLHHNKLHIWLQPGGHVELNEDPLQALNHELSEETGLDLSECTILGQAEQPNPRGEKILPLPFHFNVHEYKKPHKHIDLCYALRSNTAQLKPAEGESQRIDWFDIEDVKKLHALKELLDGTFDICTWVLNKYV